MTTQAGFLLLEAPPSSHAPGMCLDDDHSPPFRLDLLAHQVAPAVGLQLYHSLPHGLELSHQYVAPGSGLQAFKAQQDLGGQEGGELRTRGLPKEPGVAVPGETLEVSRTGTCFSVEGPCYVWACASQVNC